jgi:hypothetical protein
LRSGRSRNQLVLQSIGGVEDGFDDGVYDFSAVHADANFVADFGLFSGHEASLADSGVWASATWSSLCLYLVVRYIGSSNHERHSRIVKANGISADATSSFGEDMELENETAYFGLSFSYHPVRCAD